MRQKSKTCFRLEQRIQKGKRRAVITQRSYVATRAGIEPLMKQLHWEAMARGLAKAERVLVIAEGAVWIWNAVQDRFSQAIQRLDLYHANTYLWAVANQIHGTDSAAARRWVKPLRKQIRTDKVAKVIAQLDELKPALNSAAAKAATEAIEYYRNHQGRMKYVGAKSRGEPLGSGAIESTCRQRQCRMKRCRQFWSTQGDEALLCLEIFWRKRTLGSPLPAHHPYNPYSRTPKLKTPSLCALQASPGKRELHPRGRKGEGEEKNRVK